MKDRLDMDTIYINKTTKETLATIDKISNSQNEKLIEILPSLLIISDYGCGTTSLGKIYGNIVQKSFRVRGKVSFLELVFPKDNPRDESLFYASPQRVASTRNKFYGTMLISFEEFKGSDLLHSESFINLLDYIEKNKENIRFIFHILPDFTMKKQLVSKLCEQLNVIEVVLEKPQNEMAYEYVMNGLKEQNLKVDNEGGELFKRILSRVIEQDNYCGYKTLNKVINKISYEMLILENNPEGTITSEVIERLGWKLAEEISFSKTENRIGFHI